MATKKKASKSRAASAKKGPLAGAKKKPKVGKKKAAGAKKSAIAARKARPKARAAKTRAAKKKKGAAPISKRAATKAPRRRRDGGGHLDAKYAAELREKGREGRVRDPESAFIGRAGRSKDNLAEAMGETWVQTATSGEDENEDVFNQSVPEDDGGPFVTTTAGQEFADGTDASNPKRSKREPFPTT